MATATTLTVEREVRPSEMAPALTDPTITDEAVAESVKLRRGVLWGLFLSIGLWSGIFGLVSLLKH